MKILNEPNHIQEGQLIVSLYEKQSETDKEMILLKKELEEIKAKLAENTFTKKEKEKVLALSGRVDRVEQDIIETKKTIEMMSNNITTLSNNVITMNDNISNLSDEQKTGNKLLYDTQRETIASLWKGFYMVLTAVITIATAVTWFFK